VAASRVGAQWLTVASPDGLEEVIDDDSYGIQCLAWRRPVPEWCCEHRGGRTGPTVAGMASRRPSVTTWPCKFTRKWFEGVAGPPSRARRVSRTGVGGAVSRG
jgi:hypothetical protein